MPDLLSITNLLSLLQVDRLHAAIKMCHEAESLRRRNRWSDAIRLATNATEMVHHDYALIGITLLYLSIARLSSHNPGEEYDAIRDCDRAIRSLTLAPFNQALAQIIRAQLELQLCSLGCEQDALTYFERAANGLHKLIAESRRKKQLKYIGIYAALAQAITDRVARLSARLLTTTQLVSASEESRASAPLPSALAIPAHLVWPIPAHQTFRFVPDGSDPNTIDAQYALVDRQLYALTTVGIEPRVIKDLKLPRTGRHYRVISIAGQNRQFALVREQDLPDQDQQFIVVVDNSTQEAWIDRSEFPPPYERIHIIGADRQWNIPQPRIIGGLPFQIVGVVEFMLTPLTSPLDLREAKLQGADLSDVQLARADLSGADLRDACCDGIDLSQATLHNVQFSPATTLRHAKLSGAQLRCVDLSSVDLRGAQLQGCDLRWAQLQQARLTQAKVNKARLDGANLTGANLKGADFREAQVTGAALHNTMIDARTRLDPEAARLREVVNLKPPPPALVQAPLRGASLREVVFAGFDLTHTNLVQADLTKAELRGTDLSKVELDEANLDQANLRSANLQSAILNGAYLGYADLRRARLKDADLTNVMLHDANLEDVDLSGADLTRADLKGAKHLTQAQLDSAKSLSGAILPDGAIHP